MQTAQTKASLILAPSLSTPHLLKPLNPPPHDRDSIMTATKIALDDSAPSFQALERNWEDLIRPQKIDIDPGIDKRCLATITAKPLERGFGLRQCHPSSRKYPCRHAAERVELSPAFRK